MPGRDRTGPVGRGPMTGRGAGFCPGYGFRGFANQGDGADSIGLGGRGGRGRRNRFFTSGAPGWRYFAGGSVPDGRSFPAPLEMPQNELAALKGQAQYLANSLNDLQTRMDALASNSKTK